MRPAPRSVAAGKERPRRLRVSHATIALLVAFGIVLAIEPDTAHSRNAGVCARGPLPTNVCREIRRVAPRAHVKKRWSVSRQLALLLERESSFRWTARNPSSGACGIGQMLPCHKYGKSSCWPQHAKQAWCLLHYLHGRYRNPRAAWDHEVRYSWY